ncbi:hypothetical protein EPN96_12365 [bacterium]|nr:MAG: hypothetical protein EPN96_12365 [bacterium]
MTAGEVRRGELLALALLSAGMLLYELVLIRIFSVLMWYHFASLSIGLALLGLGAGGLAVGLKPSLGSAAYRARFTLVFAFGVVSVLLYLALMHSLPELSRLTLAPFHQPFYKPFERAQTTDLDVELAVRLTVLSVGVGWPFFFTGVVTAGVLRERAPDIKKHYAATFLGSALGCALFPLLLSYVSAPAALGVAGAFAALSAPLWNRSKSMKWTGTAVAACFVALCVWAEVSGSAEIPFARGRYDPDILAVRWNSMSRVAAFSLPPDDMLRPQGQSVKYKGEQPRQIGLVVDDSGYTNLYDGAQSAANPEFFRANLVAMPYHLRPGAKALLFGPGGGKDVWIALSFPGVTVQAVEINPQVVEMVEETFGAFTGKPYSDGRVKLAVADARRYARQDSEKYDVIGASAVFGRLPPSAGAFTLSEDLLHTAEAFEDYWDRLTGDGILSVTRFAYEQRALRLTALARDLLERKGIAEPGRHIRVVSDRGLANVMVSKKPFEAKDDEKIREVLDRYGFDLLYPYQGAGESQLSRIVDSKNVEEALKDIPFDVSAPTDDRPFFYYTVRPGDFISGSIPGRAGFDDRGAEILRLSFIIMIVISTASLLLPVLYLRGLPRVGRKSFWVLSYFFAIGFGYMVLEIGTMKRLLLVLGHPVYAVTVTLLAFLLGSGAGCLLSERMAPSRKKLGLWLLVIAVLGAVQAHFTPHLLSAVMNYPFAARFAIALLVTLPLAFAMGMPFPAAISQLGESSGNLLPWIWSVNGFASVCASLGVLLLAMNFGYSATLDMGAACYLLAFVSLAGLGTGLSSDEGMTD